MSNKGQITTLEERVMIAEQVRAGKSSREIAAEAGRSIATVRKWRQRYLRQDRAGLSSQMGRPAAGALATAPVEMKEAILELREKHPGWGAQTLQLEIAKDQRFIAQRIPSRARIAAFLKAHKKVRKYERHQDLPEPKAQPLQRPHQEWEMDAQGMVPTPKHNCSTCNASTIICNPDAGFGKSARQERFLLALISTTSLHTLPDRPWKSPLIEQRVH